MTKEEISVRAARKQNAKYDEVVKENLHHPKLIAPILKAVIPEYKGYSVEDVVQFIVKDSICDDPVDDVSAVAALDTEMSSVSEKLIRYDSHFKAINPILSSMDKQISIFLHIDLEVQNNYHPENPSYPIVKRAIYYGAREISSQLGILTERTNYDDIEKVYSIWICNEKVPEELQNTVTSYKIAKTDEIGITDEKDSDYDLMDVIVIRRGKETGDAEIFKYLAAYFSSDIEKICRYVDIRDDKEIMEGVKKMSGLGQTIYEQGQLEILINLVQKGLIKITEAAKEIGMSEDKFSELLEKSAKN